MTNSADWIWKESLTGKNITCCFRSSFVLPHILKSCSITVSAHHFFKLYVNGALVSGLVTPAPSVFQKRKWTVSYEIAPLLRQGENVLAFTVLYLGGNGQNRTKGCPGLIFEAKGILPGGTVLTIVSKPGCRCSSETKYIPGLPMREPRGLTGSTRIDNSREDIGWMLPGFDDSHWEKAVLSPATFLVPELTPQEIPEGAINREWPPALLYEEPGLKLYDAGEVLSGFVRVILKGKKGNLLCMRYGELLEGERKNFSQRDEKRIPSAMRVEHSAANDKTEHYVDEYIVQGGEETWQEDFSYRAFRYIELTGCENTEILSLTVCKAGTDAVCKGTFQCDDPSINKLAEACIETQKNGILGMLVDCPHREQAEYLGDSLMQSKLLSYNFPDARALLRKVLRDFADIQLTEGYFPFIAPVDWTAGNQFQIRMPEYDLLYSEILWQLWFLYKDMESVREFYPVAAKTAAYYLSLKDETGLIPNKQEASIHISDWPYPTIDEKGEYLFVLNAYSLRGLNRLSGLAKLLGFTKEASYWQSEHSRSALAMRAAFYDNEKGLFRDTPTSNQHHTGVNTLAFELGLFDADRQNSVLDYLKNAPFETGVILSWNYLSLLFQNEAKQQAYDIMTDPTKRWGRMIAEGSKTIWEGFENIESHSHAWNCYPLRLLQEHLLGIKCISPGFEKIAIQPFFPKGMWHLNGTVWTTHGEIHLQGQKEPDGTQWTIELPAEIEADFVYGQEKRSLPGGMHSFFVKNS